MSSSTTPADSPPSPGVPDYQPTELLDADHTGLLNCLGPSVSWSDLANPERLPVTDAEAKVELAESILAHANADRELGHPIDVGDAIINYANEVHDQTGYPDCFRRRAYELTRKELSRHTLSPTDSDADGSTETEEPVSEVIEKATLINTWGVQRYGEETIGDLVAELESEYVDRWAEHIGDLRKTIDAQQFLVTLPPVVNGWTRLKAPENAIAYVGPADEASANRLDDESEPVVALLFESDDFVRFYTIAADDYRRYSPKETDSIEYGDEVVDDRLVRVSNPESWLDAAGDLLKLARTTPAEGPTTEPDTVSSFITEELPDREALTGCDGPYPADSRRSDPVAYNAPGHWELEQHAIGGNVDLNTRRETVVWKHPFHGELVIKSAPGADSYTVSTALPRTSPGPHTDRETAYSEARELLTGFALKPGRDSVRPIIARFLKNHREDAEDTDTATPLAGEVVPVLPESESPVEDGDAPEWPDEQQRLNEF